MSRLCRRGLILIFLVISAESAAPDQWYLSNAAGMVLEYMPSRIAALRNKYCLSVDFVLPPELPLYLQEYVKPSYKIELHRLYEKGQESRHRWIFRDPEGITRLVSAAGSAPAAALEEESAEPESSAQPTGASPIGFIEIYNEHNLITEEHQFSAEGSESITAYFYNRQVLVKTETRLKSAPKPETSLKISELEAESKPEAESLEPVITLIATDNYRYSRSNALRAVERVYHTAVSEDKAGENRLTRLQFPHLGLNPRADEEFVTPNTPYNSDFLQDIILDTGIKPGDRVVYTTDERGKVLTETRQDAEGAIRGEIRNNWAGDRLESIVWKAGEDERRTEYEYDSAGDRILERDYNKGVLERTVRRENSQEIEELYMNGAVILRAVWEKGRKISEEQVRSSQTNKK